MGTPKGAVDVSPMDRSKECPTCNAPSGERCINTLNGRELSDERGTHWTRRVLIALEAEDPRQCWKL
jgi:hypothetical protein